MTPAKTKSAIKPIVSPALMLRVLKRNSPIPDQDLIPEHKLMLAVIGGSLVDYADTHFHSAGVSFLSSSGFDNYCEHLGLNPVSSRELLTKGGYHCTSRYVKQHSPSLHELGFDMEAA